MTAAPDWPMEDMDDMTHAQLRGARNTILLDLARARSNSREYNILITRLEQVQNALLRKKS